MAQRPVKAKIMSMAPTNNRENEFVRCTRKIPARDFPSMEVSAKSLKSFSKHPFFVGSVHIPSLKK